MPHPPQAPRESDIASILWALTPLLTCGYGTPFSMAWGAAKAKSKLMALAAALYLLPVLLTVLSIALAPSEAVSALAMVGQLFGSLMGGTLHSFIVRSKVFPSTRRKTPNDHALALAQQRLTLRAKAREIVRDDPALAVELRIGRPDLPRQFNDGGLVDMNHAPGPVIATVPGITPDLVERILQARHVVGAFSSAEELSVTANLPVDLNAQLAEYSVYLP
jgi:Helix-hairpin-helix motif